MTNDTRDDLQDGFSVAAMPPIGTDGAPTLPPLVTATLPPPRLCEQGPCRHYHRFEIQLDAQGARAAAIAGSGDSHGQLIGDAHEAYHTQVHHYCYPSPGVDTRLGSLPVVECNRWTPPEMGADAHEVHYAERVRRAWMDGPHGQRYREQIAEWHRARAIDDESQSQAEADAARVIAEMHHLPKG